MSTAFGQEMALADIRIGDRVRKDMGDIDALAKSIQKNGLIHPPTITPNGMLIAGQRRLLACQKLGMSTIAVHVLDVQNLLAAERDENQVRKAFTPSEAVAIGRMIEAPLRAKVEAERKKKIGAANKMRWAERRGEKVDLSNMEKNTPANLHVTAAAVVGLSNGAYGLAKEVVSAAEQAPDQFGDIVETMDATGNVSAAHNELRRRRDKQPVRHAVLRKMHHRNPNREIERAITSLSGLAMGIERIDIAGLEPERVGGWVDEIKRQVSLITRFTRRLNNECSKQA